MTRLDLRISAAERAAFEVAAGALSVPAWARAVLCATAGLTAMPRKRGADVVPRKNRGPRKQSPRTHDGRYIYCAEHGATPHVSECFDPLMAGGRPALSDTSQRLLAGLHSQDPRL